MVEIDYRIIPPKVEELRESGNVEGLTKALAYRGDAGIRQAAMTSLAEMGYIKDAVKALRTMRGELVVELLGQAFKHPDTDVRILTVKALVQNGSSNALKLVDGTLKDSNVGVRKVAVQSLGKRRSAQVAKSIATVLGDRSQEVRKQAAHELEFMGDVAVLPLIAALKHRSKTARKSAVVALGKIGDNRSLDALIRALEDAEPALREEVPMALGNCAALLRMQQKESLSPLAFISAAANALIAALEKDDPATRNRIIVTLTLMSGEDYGRSIMAWKVWAETLSNAMMNQILSKTDVKSILSEYR